MDTKYQEIQNNEWSPVKGFEGMYAVSKTGIVKGLARKIVKKRWGVHSISETLLKPAIVNGYHRVVLSNGVHKKNMFIHRIVALAFIPNPQGKEYVNHKNGDRLDNRIENLEWCTVLENNHHALETGLKRRFNPEYRHNIVAVNVETKEEYPFVSINEAARFIGEKTPGSISSFFRGERTHVKGYIFRKDMSGNVEEIIKFYDHIISSCIITKGKILDSLT